METLALVDKGVDFQTANTLDDDERQAFLIILGSLRGGKFDWAKFEWEQKPMPRSSDA